jgi:hypothetical protein
MAKCVGADVARVTAWAIVGSVMLAGEGVCFVGYGPTRCSRVVGDDESWCCMKIERAAAQQPPCCMLGWLGRM